MATYMHPIWQDTFVTLASGVSAGVSFRVQVYEAGAYVPIFTGVCNPRPGSTDAVTPVNDKCAAYLTRRWPTNAEDDFYQATFQVQAYVSGAWTTIDEITFTRDWSYDVSRNQATDIPVAPVLDVLNPRQYLPIFSNDGHFRASIIGVDFSRDFNLDFSSLPWYVDYQRDGYTYMLDLTQYDGWHLIEANGRQYRPADLCGGYVLYYINAFGGWDSLPVQGRMIQTDNYTRHTFDKQYDNNTYTARGTENYVTEIAERYVLNIGPLTTDQSARMHHLTGSTFVYLHDITTGRVHPVTLTASSAERKTRAGVLHFHEIEAQLAQERIRR